MAARKGSIILSTPTADRLPCKHLSVVLQRFLFPFLALVAEIVAPAASSEFGGIQQIQYAILRRTMTTTHRTHVLHTSAGAACSPRVEDLAHVRTTTVQALRSPPAG